MEKTNTQEPNLEIRYTSYNAVTNPYSVTNMQAAWVKLKAKFQDSVGLNINGLVDVRTTHNYIRFEASTAADVEKISNDTINEIYSYPLDVDLSDLEIADFRDDTLVPGNSLYRYASIKVGNPIPDVTYTILAALYIPEEDNLLTNTGSSLTTYSKREIGESLVEESFYMTSVTTVSPKVNLALRVKRYRPQGRIQIFDDSRNATVPLIGLKVKCQNRFRTVSGITDENGFYQCDGQLLNSAPGKYRIEFDRDKFTLMEGWLNDAEHIGPRQDSDFNHTFQGSGITTYYAKVFYGAHYYFFRDILDLRRPDYPHKGKHRLKIRCHRQPNSTQHGGSFWPKPLQPDVHIHADLLPFSQIFNYTAHEICHASLFTHRSDYKDINAYIDEANAQGVAFFITRILYPAANYLNVNPNYSNYVVDLIDDDEVQNLGSFDANSGDNVNGYTLRQIEDALLAKTINETDWKKNLKDLFVNQTEGEPLDILTNESF